MLRQIKEKIAQKIPRRLRRGGRGILLFLVLSCMAFSALVVGAVGAEFAFASSRPQLSGNDCYLEFITSDGGAYVLYARVITNTHTDNTYSSNMIFNATISGSDLVVSPNAMLGSGYQTVKGFAFGAWGNTIGLYQHDYSVNFYLGTATVVGIHGYNCNINANVPNDTIFSFSYGSDTTIQNKIDSINSVIESFKGQNQEQLNQILQAIINQGNSNTQQIKDNADKNANEIKKNQDDNSQKIIDNQNELQQKEKDETQQSGDKSTKDTQDAVPTVNEGFGSALKSFVASMSYNGTEAKLPIPRAYLPAMSGITEEITLIPEQDYNMSQAINDYLPETLLQLIRHLFTIALILYCVYELYGLIQYVLTLRKGGKEE